MLKQGFELGIYFPAIAGNGPSYIARDITRPPNAFITVYFTVDGEIV